MWERFLLELTPLLFFLPLSYLRKILLPLSHPLGWLLMLRIMWTLQLASIDEFVEKPSLPTKQQRNSQQLPTRSNAPPRGKQLPTKSSNALSRGKEIPPTSTNDATSLVISEYYPNMAFFNGMIQSQMMNQRAPSGIVTHALLVKKSLGEDIA